MAESSCPPQFFVKYLPDAHSQRGYLALINTHQLILATGCWVQTLTLVGDLLAAAAADPVRNQLNLPAGSLSLHLPEGVPRSVLEEDCFDSQGCLRLGLPLSDLPYGTLDVQPLIIQVEPPRAQTMDVDPRLLLSSESKLSNSTPVVFTDAAELCGWLFGSATVDLKKS
jgi:hypothetical protein